MRKKVSYAVSNIQKFKDSLLPWSQQFRETVWLEGNDHPDAYGSFDAILAVDSFTSIQSDFNNAFQELQEYQSQTKDWLFGYLAYDLKNDVEQLSSDNPDGLDFPELFFFQPKKIIRLNGGIADFIYLNMLDDEIEQDFRTISQWDFANREAIQTTENIHIRMGIFKDEYFRRVEKMLGHIHRGDIYEANFCQEFYAMGTQIDPLRTYQKLNYISNAPFSVYLKLNDKYLLSASPERYLKKLGTKIISQPIKGTARRSDDITEDENLRISLVQDKKERAENIMIVDLVRNDMSKSAKKSSVTVEELGKVYTFNQVHQMISTITARVESTKNAVEIIKQTFPMGSMTGAPKISAMKIIEELESFKRGLYSGAVGYFTPKGDFDFNVVIRSILYNASKQYVSFSVGSAITAMADPEKEYEECLVKAKAMREVLED